MRVDQLLNGMYRDDAIASEARTLQNFLLDWGYESEIYSNYKHTCPNSKKIALPHDDYEPRDPSDVMIYHYSLYSEVTDFYKTLDPVHRVIRYHNITPHEFWEDYNEDLAKELKVGREELPALATVTERAYGVSEYNRRELEVAGFRNTEELPLFMEWERFGKQGDSHILKTYRDGRTNLLYVGRVVPNKCFEDLLRIFNYYNHYLDMDSRLILCGSWGSSPKYYEFLKGFIEMLQLDGVVFAGPVNDRQLRSFYETASVYVSMSEHEGFCAPLVEAMHFEIPIVAYASSAIPHTLGGSGVLVKQKNFMLVAELIHEIVNSPSLRKTIVERQKERLKAFTSEALKRRWENSLRPYLESVAKGAREPISASKRGTHP
ncbi:MAG: glycosyltransferase [bacterium]